MNGGNAEMWGLTPFKRERKKGRRWKLWMRVSYLTIGFLAVFSSCSEHEGDESSCKLSEKNTAKHRITISSEDEAERILLDSEKKEILDESLNLSGQATFSDFLRFIGIFSPENSEASYSQVDGAIYLKGDARFKDSVKGFLQQHLTRGNLDDFRELIKEEH